ncbi:hypothetical protein COU75_04715 [Candidatus Peregrinibacteria bacterium CG10_big_fil_rev_8_21_14_0_10_42_8]|nr:MAG: hypothetical protein COU75_04715 [Candidatus Peregrinibacteria bacterium CG10_big_fil_rev_8_21_14_0_10_42_8]
MSLELFCHYQIVAGHVKNRDNSFMKKIILPLFSLLFFVPSTASAMLSDAVIDECKAKYPIRDYSVNFIQEKTGADPRQFFIRRCITNARKSFVKEQQIEHQQVRSAVRYNRSAANVMQLRIENENYIQDAIRRQNVKRARFRARTNTLNTQLLLEGRQSRRSIVRSTEGIDRINAIRRNLRQNNLPDPCTSVGAIRQFNNPCKDYGSKAGTTN